jgi:hypothetical protein
MYLFIVVMVLQKKISVLKCMVVFIFVDAIYMRSICLLPN